MNKKRGRDLTKLSQKDVQKQVPQPAGQLAPHVEPVLKKTAKTASEGPGTSCFQEVITEKTK